VANGFSDAPWLIFVSSEKEQELAELEGTASSANAALQQAQSLLSNLKAQLKSKKDELKGLPR
jgi:DNA repair protein RAD50